ASFVSIGVGYVLGPAPLGTGVLRYFYYSRVGLGIEAISKLLLHIMVTAILGKFSFAGLVLLHESATAVNWFNVDPALIKGAAACFLIAIVGYVLLCMTLRMSLRIRGWHFALPRVGSALAQVALGTVNYFCIAACLHQLLAASEPVPYTVVAAAYVFANF